MYAAIVKLNTLSDSVRAAAQNHNLRFIIMHRVLIRRIIGGVEIGTVFGAADMNPFPGFLHAKCKPSASDIILRNL